MLTRKPFESAHLLTSKLLNMKPYFAKYLPVEGEIKDGQMGISINNALYTHAEHLGKEYGKPVKLFLCSRDIQVGDTVHYLYDYDIEWVVDKVFKTTFKSGSTECPLNVFYKVIGEISPEAKWVKEGDEFDEEETAWRYEPEYDGPEFYLLKDYPIWKKLIKERRGNLRDIKYFPKCIGIKGPCGHFH